MPYLLISLGYEISQSESENILQDLRDNFPLHQSEGHLYRLSSRSILFEQPEHDKITLEQELWLEQKEYLAPPLNMHTRIKDRCTISFFDSLTSGCQNCNFPFDEAPESIFALCSHNNPRFLAAIRLTISENERHYLKKITTGQWHNSDHVYIRCTALVLAEIIERTLDKDDHKHLIATSLFAESITENSEAEYCLIYSSPAKYQHMISLEQNEPSSPAIYANFTRSEYAKICKAADSCGLRPSEFIRHSSGIPEVQVALASIEAAIGHLFSCNLTFFFSFFAKEIEGRHPTVNPAIQSVTATDGRSIPISIYHIVLHATQLGQILPLLKDIIIPILVGLTRKQPEQSYLAWEKDQLNAIDQAASSSARPCTEQEIIRIEETIGLTLPEAYKEFLTWMGYGAGNFMQYLNGFYPSLLSWQDMASTLLKADHSPIQLPADAFVFYMQTNQCFAFFRTVEGNDPPVYAHCRDWRRQPFCIIYHHFSDFLAVQLGIYANFLRTGEIFPSLFSIEDTLREDFFTTVPKVREAIQRKLSENV